MLSVSTQGVEIETPKRSHWDSDSDYDINDDGADIII